MNLRVLVLAEILGKINKLHEPLSVTRLLCASCLAGVDVVLGFEIASANVLEEFESTLFSMLGLSALRIEGEAFIGPDDSCVFPAFASPGLVVLFTDSKLSFCEKFDSIFSHGLVFVIGGDCDRCDGESGAVKESSSALDIIP